MSELARDPRQIGNAIQRARKARGWTQQALAGKVGTRQETISLVETGNPAARIDLLLAILAALDLEFQVAPRTKASKRDLKVWV